MLEREMGSEKNLTASRGIQKFAAKFLFLSAITLWGASLLLPAATLEKARVEPFIGAECLGVGTAIAVSPAPGKEPRNYIGNLSQVAFILHISFLIGILTYAFAIKFFRDRLVRWMAPAVLAIGAAAFTLFGTGCFKATYVGYWVWLLSFVLMATALSLAECRNGSRS